MTNIFHERYKQVHKKVPYYFYLSSDTLEEDIKWVLDNQIDSIKLTPDLYKIRSIEPILELSNIKLLDIFLEDIDLSKLNQFKQLENLGIGEQTININLSDLHCLKELYLLYHKNIKGLNTLTNLEKLILVKGDIDFFREELFSSWEKLNELALLSPRLPQNLSFLKHQKHLKELEMHNSRSKFDVSELHHPKESLEILKIGNCKGVKGIEELLPELKQLKWFALTDSITLKNSKFADLMPKLEVLIALGSSYFEDGNISNLTRLMHVSIDDKRHYNLKGKDFVSKIKE